MLMEERSTIRERIKLEYKKITDKILFKIENNNNLLRLAVGIGIQQRISKKDRRAYTLLG